MADRKPFELPQNSNLLNQLALKWLREAKEHAPPHSLHVLTLAHWGLDNGVDGQWPSRDRSAIEEQLGHLCRWKPADVLAWLLGNPNGPPAESREQERSLITALRTAESPREAAALVLNEVYSRQQADNPALQPSG